MNYIDSKKEQDVLAFIEHCRESKRCITRGTIEYEAVSKAVEEIAEARIRAPLRRLLHSCVD